MIRVTSCKNRDGPTKQFMKLNIGIERKKTIERLEGSKPSFQISNSYAKESVFKDF